VGKRAKNGKRRQNGKKTSGPYYLSVLKNGVLGPEGGLIREKGGVLGRSNAGQAQERTSGSNYSGPV